MWKLLVILAFVPSFVRADDRLFGTWKSNESESMKFNAAHAVLEQRQTIFLNQILGHLEMTFDGKTFRSYMPDIPIKSSGKSTVFYGTDKSYDYHVLGGDIDSVSILVEKELGRDRILHIHFVGESTFWIYSEESSYEMRDLNIREYFHRQ
jgi:hypothetical protein